MLFKNTFTDGFVALHAQENDYQAVFSAARKIPGHRIKSRPHRAIASLKVTPFLLTQSLVLPFILVGLLYWAQPLIFDFWKTYIEFWSQNLAFPFNLTMKLSETGRVTLSVLNDQTISQMPSLNTLVITAVTTLIGFALSLRMSNNKLPHKYPLRIICVIQFITLLYFWILPNAALYSVAEHCEELLSIGYVVLLATPIMLAMGYYILNQSLLKKILNTMLILIFLSIMIPHQVLAQALIMSHFSIVFMPVLYLCFGAVFDALVFIALYSWIVSNATVDATT
jgi:hypothetical protein